MGILNTIMGNASEADISKVSQKVGPLLAPNETVFKGFKLIRDYFVFTDQRLLMVDVQGITGSKVEYLSVPYRSITRFSVETAGSFDMDSELKLWITGDPVPLKKTFGKNSNVLEIQTLLAQYVLKR